MDYSAGALATLVSMAGASLAAIFLQWDSETVNWAMAYSLVILATANGTPNGILRVYDRFDALGTQYAVAPFLRFVSVGMAWWVQAPMEVFIVAWGSAFALGHFYMSIRGFFELKKHVKTRLWSGFQWRDVTERESDFWKFVGVVYWRTNIDLLPKHVSVLLAGGLLGPAAAGLFRLAREVSTILAQPALVLREVLFPDLTRSFHANDDGLHSIPFRTAIVAGLAGLLIVALSIVFGASILAVVGPDYVEAAPLLSLLLLAASFDLASASLRALAASQPVAVSQNVFHLLLRVCSAHTAPNVAVLVRRCRRYHQVGINPFFKQLVPERQCNLLRSEFDRDDGADFRSGLETEFVKAPEKPGGVTPERLTQLRPALQLLQSLMCAGDDGRAG